jgi:hypothetical protein
MTNPPVFTGPAHNRKVNDGLVLVICYADNDTIRTDSNMQQQNLSKLKKVYNAAKSGGLKISSRRNSGGFEVW